MTNNEDNFKAALRQAFEQSNNFKKACSEVTGLVQTLSQDVLDLTDNCVKVSLKVQLPSLAQGIVAVAAKLSAAPRSLGDDEENRAYKQYVVAESNDDSIGTVKEKILWELEFARAGYPIGLHGPEEDKYVECNSLDELKDAFGEAASYPVVGRKINSLKTVVAKDRLRRKS